MKDKINELKEFLNEANKNTYANKNALKSKSTRLGSEDYHYKRGEFIYHDTYFGGRDFIGEEIIYEKNKPIWGANYFGFIIDDKLGEKEVYGFLREVLMQDYESEVPVRGPERFSRENWSYKFLVKGDLKRFSGEEQILFNRKIVYRCFVHGGLIK